MPEFLHLSYYTQCYCRPLAPVRSLAIEPGTAIRTKTGQGSAVSALIVARGGTIIADGTYSEAIILHVKMIIWLAARERLVHSTGHPAGR